MAKFKQKIFFAPLAAIGGLSGLFNGAMAVGTGISIKQGMDAAKQNEELAAKQEEQSREMTKALNKIAKNASKNPAAAQQAAAVMGGQKMYSFTKNVVGLAKDVKKAMWTPGAKKFMKVGLASGAAMGGGAYIVDKAIQRDAKKIGMMPSEKSYAATGSILKRAGNFVKNNKGELAMSAAFGSLALPGYLSERKQFLNQQKATQQSQPGQRSYSIASAVKGWKIWHTPKETILGGANKLISMGGIGRKEVAGFGKRMAEGSSTQWGKKLGGFIQRNPGTALTGSLGVSAAAAMGSYGLGEKVTRKGLGMVDKNAFAYEKSKNQEIG